MRLLLLFILPLPIHTVGLMTQTEYYYTFGGIAAAVAVLLLFGGFWLRRSRRRRSVTQSPRAVDRVASRDEITQPLPAVVRPPVQSAPNARIRAAVRTDKGRVRSVNEDDTLKVELEDKSGDVQTGVYAVADGMGGHDKGEVASRTAIEATINALESHSFFGDIYLNDAVTDESVLDVLRDAVAGANRAVYGVKVEQSSDLGTTIVLALVMRSKAYVANVGDSRAYLIREGKIRQITEDHSLVERMVATGQITEAEARLHPQRNVIFRALGTDPQVEVDLFVEQLQPGDRILLCSDGLSGMVPDDVLGHMASQEPDPDLACQQMIRAANEAGGRDNISVVLIEVLGPSSSPNGVA